MGLCNFGLEWCNPTEIFPARHFFILLLVLWNRGYRSSLFFCVLGKNREEKDEARLKENERGEKEDEEWKSSLFLFARKFI